MKFRDAKSVLVTGASGFIGQHLVRRLIERGDRVALLLLAAEKGERLHPDGVPGQGVYFVAAEHEASLQQQGLITSCRTARHGRGGPALAPGRRKTT